MADRRLSPAELKARLQANLAVAGAKSNNPVPAQPSPSPAESTPALRFGHSARNPFGHSVGNLFGHFFGHSVGNSFGHPVRNSFGNSFGPPYRRSRCHRDRRLNS